MFAFQHESSTLLAAEAGLRGVRVIFVSDPLSEQNLDSLTVHGALPRDCSLLAKLGLVHSDLEANFLSESQNCSRVGVFTQKLISYCNAHIRAAGTRDLLQRFRQCGISQSVLRGTPGWWGVQLSLS